MAPGEESFWSLWLYFTGYIIVLGLLGLLLLRVVREIRWLVMKTPKSERSWIDVGIVVAMLCMGLALGQHPQAKDFPIGAALRDVFR